MSKKYLEEFLAAGKDANFKLDLTQLTEPTYTPLENDALFHLPFIAMSILALCKDRKFSPTTGNVGRLVGAVFERTFPAFKNSNQMLSWSASLRARTSRAQVFLEQAKLVITNNSNIELTEDGRKLINAVHNENSSLGLAIRGVCRNFRDLSDEQQLTLGLGSE